MQMGNSFAAIGTIVDYEAVARLVQAKLRRHRSRLQKQMAQKLMVLGLRFADAADFLLGNHDNVRRRLRTYVAEGQHEVIFVNNCGRDFFVNDFFENAHTTTSAHERRQGSATQQERRKSTI